MIPLLSLQSVSKSYTTRPLFDDISLVLGEGEKLALIGSNGSGKSTLLKIIAGLETPDTGQVVARKNLRIGYVPQQDRFDGCHTVEEALQLAAVGTHDPEATVSRCLGETGFTDRSALISSLSGGWKKRLSIARALATEPELLLLDEPTNHLDIRSILWLEELVSSSRCAVLFVSHDRYFIEEVARRVIDLDRRYPKGYLSVDGCYSDFLETREKFLEQMESYQGSLQNKVRREVEWLKKSARARTTKAKGRITEAHRLIEELKGINLRSDRTGIEFSSTGRKSKEMIKAVRISKAMGGRKLFSHLDVLLTPGTRLGVVGNNGSGKTTLLRILLGEIEPDSGKITKAMGLKTAFFDQARQTLNQDETLKQALCRSAAGDAVVFNGREIHIASWARRFLFRPDQLNQPVRTLSGGEQSRVLIARLMLEPADMLILDEPTNDLDIPTLEVLENTLCEFDGAIVLVTHDRFMLDRVSTSVIGFSSDGRADAFADYTQWEIWHEETVSEFKNAAERPQEAKPKDQGEKKKKITYAERIELGRIESKIMEAEGLVASTEKELADPANASDRDRYTRLCSSLHEAQRTVEELYARWHELELKNRLD